MTIDIKRKRGEKPPISRREMAFVIGLMVGGVVFATWSPLMIAPPHLKWSFVVYAVIELAWIPVLAYFSVTRRRPQGIVDWLWLIAIGFPLVMLFTCGLGATMQFSAPYRPSYSLSVLHTDYSCSSAVLPEARVQYQCVGEITYSLGNYWQIVILEGVQSLPFAWVVDSDFCLPGDCQLSE